MEYLTQNWWYLLWIVGFAFIMIKGGGCCGHNHKSNNENSGGGCCGGKDSTETNESGQMNSQIEMARDPICGMHVNPDTAIKQNIDGVIYYFCSENCRKDFISKSQR